jgi:peroxiredoxin-like protein
MQPFPHHYPVSASSESASLIKVTSEGKPDLITGPPKEFGGTGDEWSPEDLLVAAVVDCYILSFKAIAKASHFEWISLDCDSVGTLDKVERFPQFTGFTIKAKLVVPSGISESDMAKAERLLKKAEAICLITNSLKFGSELEFEIVQA